MPFRAQKIWDTFILGLLVAGFITVIVMAFGTPANAEHTGITPEKTDIYCGLDGAMEAVLQNGYGEVPVQESFTDMNAGGLFTWWESFEVDQDVRTWSLTLTHPDGKTCLIAAGTMNWEKSSAPEPPEDLGPPL